MSRARWLGLPAMYVAAQLAGLALAGPFRAQGLASSSNPQSPTTPLFFILVIVIAPLFILLFARRRGGVSSLRQVILLAISASLYVTLYATFAILPPGPFYLPPLAAGVGIDPALPLAAIASAGIYLALLVEPQWYVVDLAGLVAGGALVAILGISFGILPAMILLGALMVYDAIAVYRTKHMVTLADAVTEMKLPILMVMPEGPGFDYPSAPPLRTQRQAPVGERAAMFMGLGDIVIPGTLVVSAFAWLPSGPALAGIGPNLVTALGTLAGSLVGYAFLMRRVAGGEPQAGLPFLNGGALVGYALTYVLVFRSYTLGLTGGL